MLPQGSRIGPYRIDEDLGGTSTEVYRAWDEELRRPVVLKRLPSGADAAARERFHRGAVLAAELDHPAIVRVHALLAGSAGGAPAADPVGSAAPAAAGSDPASRSPASPAAPATPVEAGETDLLVMELVTGETLAHRLEVGVIEAPLAHRLGAQIAAALAAAHERGITHGRLTAERVIVRPDGQAKILGFGFDPGGAQAAEDLAPDARDGDLRALAALLRRLWSGAEPPPAVHEWSERLSAAASRAGDLPIAPGPTTATGSAPVPRRTRGHRIRIGRLGPLGLAGAGLLAAVIATGVLWLRSGAEPLAVRVPDPVLAPGSGAEAARLSAGLKASLLHTLSDLEGIVPLSSSASRTRGAPGVPAPAGKVRQRGAAEVLATRLSCRPPTCEIILSRLTLGAEHAGGGSRLLWTGTFETPAGRPDLLAEAVESHIRQAYRGFPPRAAARPGE